MRVMFNENSLQVASVASLASKLQASSRSASPIRKLQVPSIYIHTYFIHTTALAPTRARNSDALHRRPASEERPAGTRLHAPIQQFPREGQLNFQNASRAAVSAPAALLPRRHMCRRCVAVARTCNTRHVHHHHRHHHRPGRSAKPTGHDATPGWAGRHMAGYGAH